MIMNEMCEGGRIESRIMLRFPGENIDEESIPKENRERTFDHG